MAEAPDAGAAWREVAGGVRLLVRLTPKSARDKVEGVGEGPDGPVIRARVRAIPEKGKANAALEKLIGKWLGVPRSTVSVASGGRSRIKTLHILGDGPEIIARIEAALSETG